MDDPRSLMIASVAQEPTALVLSVTNAELPFRPQVLSARRVEWGTTALQFSIIGESHFVRVERSGYLWLHEVLACTPLRSFSGGHIHRFDDLLVHDYAKGEYRVRVSFSQSPPTRPLNTADSLTVHFPRQHEVMPLTHIAWQIDEHQITWWTLHTYPEARYTTYVLSESTLQSPDCVSK